MEGAVVTKSPDRNREKLEKKLLEEIEKARKEIQMSERAFQWAKKDSAAIDAAILRMQAAVEHFTFLLQQAKKLGIKEDKKRLYEKLLKHG
jgi:hypothetical protein